MNDPNSIVAVYDSHTAAEQAVAKLSADSFDIKKVSIIGKDYHTEENVLGYYTAGDRMKSWGGLGWTIFGRVDWRLGIGGGRWGLSALAAGLVSLGIPKDSAVKYEAESKADNHGQVHV